MSNLRDEVWRVQRYLETLFRRKGIFLTPLLVTPLVALAFWALIGSGQQEVSATLWVEPSPLLVSAPSVPGRTALSPNEEAAGVLSQWLATETFRQQVIEDAGLADRVRSGDWPRLTGVQVFTRDTGLDSVPVLSAGLRTLGLAAPASQQQAMAMALRSVRDDVDVTAEGSYLLLLTHTGDDPALGTDVVNSILTVYRDWAADRRAESVGEAVAIQTRQVELQEERVQAAGDRLNEFLAANPAPRAPAVEAQADRLRQAYALEQEVHADALRRLSSLRMDGEASVSSGAFTMHMVDAPQVPAESGGGMRLAVMMLFLGLVVGSGIGIVAIAMITWADGTVRSRQDLTYLPDIGLTGEVPWKSRDNDGPHMAWLLARNAKA
jgi:uncharacterized protein involved in exopolysaccharide biosynthesis